MEHLLYNGRFLPFLMFLLHFIRAIYHSPALLAYQDGPLAASLSLSSRATTTSVARGSRQKIVRETQRRMTRTHPSSRLPSPTWRLPSPQPRFVDVFRIRSSRGSSAPLL